MGGYQLVVEPLFWKALDTKRSGVGSRMYQHMHVTKMFTLSTTTWVCLQPGRTGYIRSFPVAQPADCPFFWQTTSTTTTQSGKVWDPRLAVPVPQMSRNDLCLRDPVVTSLAKKCTSVAFWAGTLYTESSQTCQVSRISVLSHFLTKTCTDLTHLEVTYYTDNIEVVGECSPQKLANFRTWISW